MWVIGGSQRVRQSLLLIISPIPMADTLLSQMNVNSAAAHICSASSLIPFVMP